VDSPVGLTEIELGGKKYPCKTTFSSLVLIEQNAGCGLIKIFDHYSKLDVRAQHVTAIIYGCIKGGDPSSPLTFDQVGELLHEDGFENWHLKAFLLVKDALRGPKKKVPAEPVSQ